MAIKPRVIPLGGSNFSWDLFLKNTIEYTGHNPVRAIDESKLDLKNHVKYLAALGEFHSGKKLKPLETLRNSDMLLSHLFLSFFLICSSNLILMLNELTQLSILSTRLINKQGRIAIISAPLKEWKSATIELCNSNNKELQQLGNIFIDVLFHMGFHCIFSNYTRVGINNGTFYLEHKK